MDTELDKIGGTIMVHEGTAINPKAVCTEVPSIGKEIFNEAQRTMENHLVKGGRKARAGTAEIFVYGMRGICKPNVEWNVVLQCGSSEFQSYYHQ